MLKRAWKKTVAMLLVPSGLGGAFLGLALFQMNPGSNRLAGLVVGWLYGISVWGLMRVLSVAPAWAWLAGIFAGPIPIALLMPRDTPAGERGVILIGALLGCLLGLLEMAHSRRSARAGPAAPHSRSEPADRLEP
ncbi:MAG: hypothetical protein HOP15_08000 [Planctomycetes bacterium]|nr:hypothetical protein [Planctomycetota bacterium]